MNAVYTPGHSSLPIIRVPFAEAQATVKDDPFFTPPVLRSRVSVPGMGTESDAESLYHGPCKTL
jgi:hypothetical protein